jgi:glutathione S-transferase
MSSTYTLFYAPGAANMAPHAALEEIGTPHKLVHVDLVAGEQRRPEYLKLNPKGRVPLLVDGDYTLTESAAILMHLADRHPDAKLAPPLATPERGHYYQWLLYLSNTVQMAFFEYFYADRFVADAAGQGAFKANAALRLAEMLVYIDDALAARGPYLLGDRYAAPDLFLHMLARWSRWLDKPAYRHQHIKRCTDLVKARPAVIRMMAAEGIVEQEKA